MAHRRGFQARVRSEQGSALPLALLSLLLISLLGFTVVAMGLTEVTVATNWRAYSRAFYAADAGIESGVNNLRTLLAQGPNPTAEQLGAITPPSLNTMSQAQLSFVPSPPAPAFVARIVTNPPSFTTSFTTGPFATLTGRATNYRVTSQVTGPGAVRANLSQIFSYVQVPLFQFGVFYGKGVDLEIAPGINMTFNGRVHSNSNIYVGTQATLSFQSYMTTTGNIYRRIKRDAAIPWHNHPQIMDAAGVNQTLDFDHEYQQGFATQWPSPNDWKNFALSRFGGQVRDSAMGVGEIIPPIPELFVNPSNPDVVAHQLIETVNVSDSPALQAAKLYTQAALRIINGVATDQNGAAVALPAGVVTTNKSFWDNREQRTMSITELNVGSLISSGKAPTNGILYIANTSVSTGVAVRVVNGATLPSNGFTVVSQNPVYVQGDYNTLGTYTTATGGTANHVPAAILADAITVLSNNWGPNSSDTKGNLSTSNRSATNTTVNAAFATGPSAESAPGAGNGQLENNIRFLEDWSGGKTFTYKGSIVDLWHSQQATGAWRSPGNGSGPPPQYYQAPVRNWSYDTLFNTDPPPGTPSGVIMVKGAWSQN